MPDWNKEISFRKKKPAPAVRSTEPSIWKREIGFGKKKQRPVVSAPPAVGDVPWWRREIGGGSKKSRPVRAVAPVAHAVPWWRKELGGKRKQRPDVRAAALVPPPARVHAAEPVAEKVPWWRKEIGGKKKTPAPEAATPQADDVPFWKRDISLGRTRVAEPTAEAAVAPPQPAVEVPEPAVVSEPAPELDYSWLTATMGAEPPEAPAEQSPAEVGWPPRVAGSEATAAAWPPRSDEAPVAATWPPRAEAPAAAPEPPVAEPVAVVAPAAPDPPAPAPAPEAKVPFWKKELSLGGKKPAERATASEPKPEAAEKVPFWKKELSLRGRKPAATPMPEAAEKVPFWKRELGKPKAERTPKAEKTPRVKGDSVPFWKKDISFGGGTPKQPRPAKSKPVTAESQRHEKALIVGLKIGASQVAAARVQNNGHPHLLQVAREPLDDGVVVGGELRDVEALAETLKRFFAKHKLPRKGVRLGIANNRIGVRTFEISGIDEPRQLANAIRFRAQETLPIPLEEAVLDWQVLRETTDANGVTTRRVLLVVAYRELVDRYVLACKKAGIRLEGIDLEAFAMLRALAVPAAEDAAPPGAQVVVNVGHDRSTFAVSDGRICEFTRVLAWGGQSLNVAIARALDVTPSEAAPLKHAMSLVDDSIAVENLAPERAAAACTAVRNELQSFARELVSSLRFYQNQPGSLGIAELMLTGGTADLPGFADELQRLIGVAVRVGDPLGRVKLGKRVPEQAVGSLAVAIGLGIED